MADMNAGTIFATLKLTDNMSGTFKKANENISQSLRDTERKFGQLYKTVDAVSTKMLMFGAGGAAASAGLIKLAMNMEQTKVAFTSLLGSGEAATRMLENLKAFATTTPFQFTDLTDSTKRLMAFGFQAQEVIPILTDLGDAVSAMGGGKELMDRAILAIGQMQAKAKVTAGEMRQITEAGIPGWRYLAEALGKTTAEVMKMSEKGIIPASVGIRALREGMRKDFGGMMAEQAKTAAGELSNFLDQAKMVGAELGESMLPAFKAGVRDLKGFADVVGDLTDGQKEAIGKTMLYGSAALLVTGIVGKAAGPFKNMMVILGGIALNHIKATKAAASNAAAALAHANAQQAEALALTRAAAAATAEAEAMEREFIATGQATEADIAFVAGEKVKAATMTQNAAAATTQATALRNSANVTRLSFLGLTPAVWAAVGVVGAFTAAMYLAKKANEEVTASYDGVLDVIGKTKTKHEEELHAVEEEIRQRENLAKKLTTLESNYDRLSKQAVGNAIAAGRLKNVKTELAETISKVSKVVGDQSLKWDGTAGSIRRALAALQDMTKQEVHHALVKAKLAEDDARVAMVKKQREVHTRQQRDSTLQGTGKYITQEYAGGGENRFQVMQRVPAAKTNREKLEESNAQFDLDEAHKLANDLEYMFSKGMYGEALRTIKPTGTEPNPYVIPEAGGGSSSTKKTPEEIHRAWVQRAADILAAVDSEEKFLREQGKIAEADKKTVLVMEAQAELRRRLGAGISKYGAMSEVGVEDRKKLVALEEQIADATRERTERELTIAAARAEQTRTLHDDLETAQAATKLAEGRKAADPAAYLVAQTAERRASEAYQGQRLGDVPGLFATGSLATAADAIGRVQEIRAAWRGLTNDANELLMIDRQIDATTGAIADQVTARYKTGKLLADAADADLERLRQAAETEEAREVIQSRRLEIHQAETAWIMRQAGAGALTAAAAVRQLNAQRQKLSFLTSERQRADELNSINEKMLSIYNQQVDQVDKQAQAKASSVDLAVDELKNLQKQLNTLDQTTEVKQSIEAIDGRIKGLLEGQTKALREQQAIMLAMQWSRANLTAELDDDLDVAGDALNEAQDKLDQANAAMYANPDDKNLQQKAQAAETERNNLQAAYNKLYQDYLKARAAKAPGAGVVFTQAPQGPEGEMPEPGYGRLVTNDDGSVTIVPTDAPITVTMPADAFKGFGEALWNFTRDKGAVGKYLDGFAGEMQKKGVGAFLAGTVPDLFDKAPNGLPMPIVRMFPKLGNMSEFEVKELQTKVQGGAAAAASAYGLTQINTTNPIEGAFQGGMAGLGIAGGLSQMGVAGMAGPIGWGIVGASMALGVLQSGEAQKEAEEQAQRIREAQLAELKKIDNRLKPVEDFFNRGAFGALSPTMSYAGGMEYAWAVAGRRGML